MVLSEDIIIVKKELSKTKQSRTSFCLI